LGGKIAAYRMSPLDSFQIDEESDLQLIESLLKARPQTQRECDLSRIRLLVLDFDGVLTDNRVTINQDGLESVTCHRGDGWGIARLKESGVEVLVLSSEVNSAVSARCAKLGIDCIQGLESKLPELKRILSQRSLARDEAAYFGNDVNDLECMQWVGVPIAVADAVPEVRSVSRLITAHLGGRGAVREIADAILSAQASRSSSNKQGG
jgi:N-acylneuraminate cytidylyltransferase